MTNTKFTPYLLGSLVIGSSIVCQSSFAATQLSQGYMLGSDAVSPAKALPEAKCGEGRCGIVKRDKNKDGVLTPNERSDFSKAAFVAMDTNKDSVVTAAELKTFNEGKCGEGRCGAGRHAVPTDAKTDKK